MLALDHVDKRYANGVLALRDVSLAVGPHESVSLLGPSGCGKSSVLRLVAGLIGPWRSPTPFLRRPGRRSCSGPYPSCSSPA
ncbi:MAG: ATP-binding cassette domain-containing protein [Rhizobacter sp.]|nr:ATP-binding cassette domain-containing protein [Rhizobacter sp.]